MTHARKALAALALVAAVLLTVACTSGGSLEGTSWKLTEWSVSSIDPARVTITAKFANGRIGGSGGVNSYSGPYTAGPGTAFKAGTLTSTLMAGPEPAMHAETAYFALLAQVASYRIHGDTLTMMDAGGNESLVLTRAK